MVGGASTSGGNGGGNCAVNGGSNSGGAQAAPIPLPPVGQASPVITAGNGQKLTVINPSAVAVSGTVLSANGRAATIGGEVISLDPSTGVVVGGAPGAVTPILGQTPWYSILATP